MTRRHAPRLALALLERCISDGSPLAGDLIEEFERRQSIVWFWWQVLAAIAIASFNQPGEIRPLQLVDLQPADAVERSRRMMRSECRAVNLSASPLSGVGGLGLLVLVLPARPVVGRHVRPPCRPVPSRHVVRRGAGTQPWGWSFVPADPF